MADTNVDNSSPPKSTSSSDELVALAELQRARIVDNASALKKSIAPDQLADTAKIAASESFDSLKVGLTRQPLLAGGGALALGAFLAPAYWGRSNLSRRVKQTPASDTGATLNISDKSASVGGHTRGFPVNDIVSLIPKLGIALAGGYVLERALPRTEGESELWNEVREHLVRNIRERSREHISELALSRSSPIPWLGIATIATHLLLKR